MKIVLPRALSGVFCDDIRQEAFGKKTLVGCYSGTMEVSAFPAILPKLCVHGVLQTPADRPFQDVKLLLMRDEEILIEGQIPIPAMPGAQEVLPNALQRLDVQFVMSPLVLEGPCTLKLRAHADGEELRGLALAVREMPVETADKSREGARPAMTSTGTPPA